MRRLLARLWRALTAPLRWLLRPLQPFFAEDPQDTPLAETAIVGTAIGMAAMGLKPVAEIQFSGFIYPAFDHLVNHASRLRHRTRGRLSCPLVLRSPSGGGIHAPEHHSESPEAMLAHVPGLRVVVPSSPARAYGLLVAAIRDPDPVLVLEHEQLYAHEGDVAEWDAVPAFGRAAVVRGGRDVTVVAYSHATLTALEAASRLADKGISVEVVDLRSLRPLDMPAVFGSLAKTRRLVVVEEGWPACSVGSEICSRVATEAFGLLAAGPVKVSGADVPMPYAANLERLAVPDACDVVAAVERLCYRSPVASD